MPSVAVQNRRGIDPFLTGHTQYSTENEINDVTDQVSFVAISSVGMIEIVFSCHAIVYDDSGFLCDLTLYINIY